MKPRSVLAVVSLLAGCASAPPFDAKAVAIEWAAYMQRDYPLRSGDRLAVRLESLAATAGTRDDLQEVIVSPTGTIDLRHLDLPINVGGRSIGAARTMIMEAYRAKNFTEPKVSVSLIEASAQTVYVCGEVSDGGAIPFQAGMTLAQAIAAAGGFLITIKDNDVRVLRISPDGTQRTFRVNYSAVLLHQEPDFLLLPGDVIYCQTSTIADLGNLVELYIRRLLPFAITGVSVGGN